MLSLIDLADPALVFHSFRHGWRDAAELTNINERIVRYMGGWANTEVHARYGNPGFLPTLAKAVDTIRFEDFVLPGVPTLTDLAADACSDSRVE